MKIEFNSYDLTIREFEDGGEYVAFRNYSQPDFVKQMKEMGVTKWIKKEKEEEETEE